MDLFIDKPYTVVGISPVFFPCMLPTPLCGIFLLLDHNEQTQVDRLVCGKWDVRFWLNHDFLTDDDYCPPHTQSIEQI